MNAGYATVGTDTGHQGSVTDASWALNNLERQVNFGYLAVHRTAEVAKAIIRSYYGSTETRAYFSGCSNGGRQALMEAQRYPDDFDGIVAGAPAADFIGDRRAVHQGHARGVSRSAATRRRRCSARRRCKSVEAQIVEKCDAHRRREGRPDGRSAAVQGRRRDADRADRRAAARR